MTTHNKVDASLRDTTGKAGDWESVIDILYQEHGDILSLLESLGEQADLLQRGSIPDFPLLLDMIDYLLHFPDEYHHPREDLIYAGLRRADPAFRPSYDRLQQEHRVLHERNELIFRELSRIGEGQAANTEALRRMLLEYIDIYRKHIKFESNKIFPIARGSLTPAQLKKIEDKTRFRDDPLFSKKIWQRYNRLQRTLRHRVGELEESIVVQQFSLLEQLIETLSDTLDSYKEKSLLSKLPNPARLLRGPSWQARLMNAVTRNLMKPMLRFGSIDSMRAMTLRFDAEREKDLPEDVQWKYVSGKGYEGERIQIKGKRPRKVLLYFPGGAFIMRTAVAHRGLVSRFCRGANCKALLVHYRLAPEHPFPGGLEDCLAAYHALLEEGVKPENISLAGDSAGGGLVLSTLLALRDQKSPMPANAIILSPLGDLTYTGESRQFNKHRDPMLPTHRASSMHELYIGNASPEDRYISPVLADFEGLPPMLGVVGSTEILLDDTVRAAERAREAGVPFNLEIWREMPHVFQITSLLPESQISVDRISEYIRSGQLDLLPTKYGWCEGKT